MKIAVIDCGSVRVPEIVQLVNTCHHTVELMPLDSIDVSRIASQDAAIISGGPHLFTDPQKADALHRSFEFIDDLTLPILGICLGHQALGIRAGATVYRGEERRDVETLTLSNDHPLFYGFESEEIFTTDHCEGIETPESYSVIAHSKSYPVEAIARESDSRYGVQFHPESTPQRGHQLFLNFFSIVQGKP